MAEAQNRLPRGVIAAALTPLDDELNPDHQALVRHYRHLLEQGCNAIVALGTSGEANSLTVGERLSILDALADTDLMPRLIVGTGCCAIPDTVHLTRLAVEAGAAGVLVLPPFYYKQVSDEGLFAAFSRIIEGVGDERLRLYLYHIPQLTGVPLGLPLVERLLERYPRTVVGLKDSSGDWAYPATLLRSFEGLSVFCASEALLLPLLRNGGSGCISATANVLAPLAADLFACWESPRAEALQQRLARLRQIIQRYPLVAATRVIMARRTGDPSWLNMRPPLWPLSEQACAELFGTLDTEGFEP